MEKQLKAPGDFPEMIMNVPHPLDIEGHPELSVFPLNILFNTLEYGAKDEKGVNVGIYYALYEPDFNTYSEDAEKQEMYYYNKLSRKFWSKIIYDKVKKIWTGCKFRGEENIGMADGKSWDLFFMHLTLLGLIRGKTIRMRFS